MQFFPVKSRVLLGDFRNHLQKYLPVFLINHKGDFTQPLLSSQEIVDLQLRVNSRNSQPIHSYDSEEQRMGNTPSAHRGYGLDYEESRTYLPGDEPRYINWKLAARTGELYMKVFREERHPGVFVLLDRRKSMLFGTQTRLKVTQAARVATCITFYAQQCHSSISAIVLEAAKTSPTLIKETDDKQAAAELIRTACAPCPPIIAEKNDSSHQSTQEQCEFDLALNMLHEIIIPGSTLYLIGDFIDLGEQHRAKLMQLSAHNNVNAIHIVDPSEKHLPEVGALYFHTTSSEQDISIDTSNYSTNKAYENSAINHFNARKTMFNTLNIKYKEIATDCEEVDLDVL